MKRMSKAFKHELAHRIIEVALEHIANHGEFDELKGKDVSGNVKSVTIEGFHIGHITPFSRLVDHRDSVVILESGECIYFKDPCPQDYCIDIWPKVGQKVFSAWWDPFHLTNFKKGHWIDEFLATGSNEHTPIFS